MKTQPFKWTPSSLTWLVLLIVGFVLMVVRLARSEDARLMVEKRGLDVVVFVTNGVPAVQYQIFTSPDNTVASTNWYYWNRVYSIEYGNGEKIVYNHMALTNQAASKPYRFFQIRGVLPD